MKGFKKYTNLFLAQNSIKKFKNCQIRFKMSKNYTFAKEKEELINDFNIKEYLNTYNEKSNSLYTKVLNFCDRKDKIQDISTLKEDLKEIGMNKNIPDYAYTILIDKCLHNKQFNEIIQILNEANLNDEILDIPLYEDLLFAFCLNNNKEGIEVTINLFEKYFDIPTINFLIYAKEAFDKNLIEEKTYNRIFDNFINNNIEKVTNTETLEEFIQVKQNQLQHNMTDKIKLNKKKRILDYQYKNLDNEKEDSKQNVEIKNIENGKQRSLEKETSFDFFEETQNDNVRYTNLENAKTLGYIELFLNNDVNKNKIQIGCKFIPDDFENSEDISTEEYSEETSSDNEN